MIVRNFLPFGKIIKVELGCYRAAERGEPYLVRHERWRKNRMTFLHTPSFRMMFFKPNWNDDWIDKADVLRGLIKFNDQAEAEEDIMRLILMGVKKT